MPEFPKTEKITFRLRQDLADRIPPDPERGPWLNRSVELTLSIADNAKKAGSTITPKKSATSAENGKKGGRPRKKPAE
ncbi:hypothetical protein AGMMS49940_05790 [Spirochaetia bacterium]|nr:hypothetical protein AGMMS49940_05790 [Spirochaetia bacterium]